MNRQPDINTSIFRLLDCSIEGKPASKIALGIVIKLAGFERGVDFLSGKNNELKPAFSFGIRNDQKAVE